MRVLGIDPGSRITGFGLVESHASELKHVAHGALKLGNGELSDRLKNIFDGLSDVIKRTQPDIVAVEKVFMATNANSALILGHARGAAICAAVHHNLTVFEYTALQIKRAVVGNGRTEKSQVQHMIRVLLGLKQKPSTDAADALACSICHINTAAVSDKIRIAAG